MASGGVGPYTWSISRGTLPSGLDLTASSGEISGIPNTAGTSNFTVTDAETQAASVSQGFSITINALAGCATSNNNYGKSATFRIFSHYCA